MSRIDREFGEKLLTCFDDPQNYGVHLLFNEWWASAPQEAIDKYEADFEALPRQKAFDEARWFAPNLSLEDLKAFKPGTVGRTYYHFIADNSLEANLATNYKMLHDMMRQAGNLDRMPDSLNYAIIRGFQIHDLLHVLTGYEATPDGEIALQAFCLAQIRFPYFGMWMSNVTTRMTLLDPDMIVPTMDAVSEGWQYGRRTNNLQFERWEDQLDRPLAEVRHDYNIDPPERAKLAA